MKITVDLKKIFLVLFSLLIINKAYPQNSWGIKFDSLSFSQAIEKSNQVKKPIFLFGYASWCHFCEEMKDSVLSDSTVGSFYNYNFICIKLDLEKEGADLNKTIRAKNFPTLMYYNEKGEMLHRAAGKKQKNDFIQIGLNALDSTKQLRTISLKYRDGKLNPEETYSYFKLVENAGMDNQSLINNYLMGIPEPQLFIQPSWRILYELFKDIDQPCLKRVLENRDTYAKYFTADSIDNKVLTIYYNALMYKVQMLDSNGYSNIINKLRMSDIELASKIIAYSEVGKLKMKSQWLEYKVAATTFIEKYCKNDYRRLNDIANTFFERVPDKDLLLKAENWAEQAVKLMDNYKNNLTLANLYHKNSKDSEARKVLNHAIELGKKANIDTKQAMYLMGKLTN